MAENSKNRFIITKGKNNIFSCLYQNQKMVQVNIYPWEEKDRKENKKMQSSQNLLGNIYVGKVKNIVKNINAAFVEISNGLICYLSLEKAINPIFTREKKQNSIAIGDELLVQVSKVNVKTKAPVVTVDLNFTGKYVVLIHGKPIVAISSKISNSAKREELKECLSKYQSDSYGFIARTNSESVDIEKIIQEVNLLILKYEKVKKYGIYKNRFSLVYETPPGYICDIRDNLNDHMDEIITDHEKLYKEISSYIEDYQPEDSLKLRFYKEKDISLNKLYGIEGKIKSLLKEKVWLKSGGSIIIQPTEALIVIDVNTEKAIKGKKRNPQKTFFNINLEAGKEIARQVRLRNLSGIIIIDFIDMNNKEDKEILMQKLRQYFAKDPVKTVLIGMTSLNLVEVTRKKIRKPIYELITIKDLDDNSSCL